MSPPNTRRQHSQVRFLDSDTYIPPPSYSPGRHSLPPTMATPNSHTYPRDRNGSLPTARNTPTAPMTSPAPVFNNPFVTQPSPAVDTDDMHTVHIADRSNYDDVENNGYARISRVSAVPFAPNQRPQAADHWDPQAYYSPQTRVPVEEASQDNDDRRGSDETLTGYVAPSAYPKTDKDYTFGPPRPSDYDPPRQPYGPPQPNSAHPTNNNAARKSSRQHDIENQSSDFDVSAGNNPGMTDEEHAKLRHGFFNHVKDSLNHLTRDSDAALLDSERNTRHPSLADSRRNSWSGEQPAQKSSGPAGRSRSQSMSYPENQRDNFERSMAFNEDYDETYLLDDDGQHRSVREAVFNNPRLRVHPHNQQSPELSGEGRRKSYSERRKREKHRIIHCAEPAEEYQKFILTFAKALLAFGSPSHRIEAQLNSLAKVFELEAQFQHTPGTIQVSFGNPEARSSETCLIKSPVGLALGRIYAVHNIYRAVLHDDMYASHGTRTLRKLLNAKPHYGSKTRAILSFITCLLICGVAFGGSLNDMWAAGVMGLVVRIMQTIASKSELSASGSEVFTAAIVSLVARALSTVPSQIWCFTAISSSGIISLLPGYLILSGSLDIAGKNQALGAPKIVSGIMTSLYLGFGLTLGSDVFLFVDRPARRFLFNNDHLSTNMTIIQGFFQASNGSSTSDSFAGSFSFTNLTDASLTLQDSHIVQGCYRDPSWGWYLQPMPFWTLFFLVPLFAFCASMNNQQHWWSRQMVVMVTIACISFWITRLCNVYWGLHNHPDYVSLIGSWFVGILGNGYSRRFGGTAFTAMLTGVLLLVPDGLAAAGGLSQNYQNQGQDEYTQSLTLARKMISVIIGIMAGVYSSAAIIYLFGKKKNAALVTF